MKGMLVAAFMVLNSSSVFVFVLYVLILENKCI